MTNNRKWLTLTLALYVVYSLQGIFYSSGTVLTQGILLIFLLIGLYGLFKTSVQQKNNPSFTYVFALFFLMHTLIYIISAKYVNGSSGLVPTFGSLKSIYFVILSFYAVYMFSREACLTSKYISVVGIVLVVVAVLRYFYSLELIQQDYDDTFQNNGAYCIIAIVPFLPFLFERNKLLTSILSLALIALILNAAKRGAIVCLIVSLAFAAIYMIRQGKMSVSKQFVMITAVAVVAAFMYYTAIQNDFLLDRIEAMTEGHGSGREVTYSQLWQHWQNSDLFHMIFGYGMSQSYNVCGNSAHNDWLELLTDNGVLGVTIYLIFFIKLFMYIRSQRGDSMIQLSMYLAMIIFLTKTLFSMSYPDFGNAPITIALGLCAGKYESEHRLIKQTGL